MFKSDKSKILKISSISLHIDIYFKLQVNCSKYSFCKIALSKIEFNDEKFLSAQMNFET